MKAIWPRTLFLRLALAWCLALFATHLINVGASYIQTIEYQTTHTSYYLAKDLSILLPALEVADAPARKAWLQRMARKSYRFELVPAATPTFPPNLSIDAHTRSVVEEIERELGPRYPVAVSARGNGQALLLLHLADRSVLEIHLFPFRPVFYWSGGIVFLAQALAVLTLTWIAVRRATAPLQRLAEAAEVLGASMQCEPIAEDGPLEVARAAVAFNTMGHRIKEHLAERVRILAAISHDLQTPITRMRLRAELVDNPALRGKMEADLDAMQALVEEGITYARSTDMTLETPCTVDIGALLDTVVCDYADADHIVRLNGPLAQIAVTRPHTLRRVVINLADNALKFAGEAEIVVRQVNPERLVVCVRDRGPGIAPEHLAHVFEPFYRIENSRNRGTGGTGLGLAIAQQLTLALGGTLALANREGGGLEATLTFPIALPPVPALA